MQDQQHQRHHRGRPSEREGVGVRGDDVLARLAELARELAAASDLRELEQLVVAGAVADVPGAEHASICVSDRCRRGRTVVATSDLARLVDALQYQEREGPCLDTLFEEVTVRTGPLGTDPRWPRFGVAAARAGVHSMMSVQLFTDGRDLGALNLFAAAPETFTDRAEQVALALAAHAAVATVASEQIRSLHLAVDSRDVIGQAKGVLMERHRVDDATAFAVLVRYSRDTNVKLVDIARNVIEHGAPLPGERSGHRPRRG